MPRLQSGCRVIPKILCEARIEARIDDVCDDNRSSLHHKTSSESGLQFGMRLEIYGTAKRKTLTLLFYQIAIVCCAFHVGPSGANEIISFISP